jgi:hypothetical protein
MDERRTGISNRETAAEEAKEREEHSRETTGSLAPQDSAGQTEEQREAAASAASANSQTSHKAGARSIAQKEDATRYPDRSMPATHKKAGAFGKEPRDVAADEGTD